MDEVIKLYKDKDCKEPLDKVSPRLSDILVGEVTKINVYACNEGNHNLERLKVTVGQKNVEVEGGDRKSLKPDEVWRFTLAFNLKDYKEVQLLKDEIDIIAFEVPKE